VRDLRGGAARDLLDVVVELLLRLLHLLGVALSHAVAIDDQVDQDADEARCEQQDDPEDLLAAADVVATEQVAEDRDQQPEPDDEAEDEQHRPEQMQ
jgi:hypothetical protein